MYTSNLVHGIGSPWQVGYINGYLSGNPNMAMGNLQKGVQSKNAESRMITLTGRVHDKAPKDLISQAFKAINSCAAR